MTDTEVCSSDESGSVTGRAATASRQGSLTPSPAPSTASLGHPRRSPVWDYFVFDKGTEKSIGQVEVPLAADELRVGAEVTVTGAKVCGHAIAGKYPTNLKQHLKKAHSVEFKDVVRKEVENAAKGKKPLKRKSIAHGQMTLGESFQRKYEKGSERYQFITRRLAFFVGSTNVANRIVEDAAFQSLLETLDAKYSIPGRAAIGKEIDKLLLDMKLKVEASLAEARKISLCADIWSKKGMSSSYLGMTAHFFSQCDHRHQVTLAVRRLPHPHTGSNIRDATESILEEWGIPLSRVRVIITDNGSNMVAAFRWHFEEDDEEDEEERDDGSVEEAELEASVHDQDDFEDKEIDHDTIFKFYCKRLSCFSHTLQLVVNKF